MHKYTFICINMHSGFVKYYAVGCEVQLDPMPPDPNRLPAEIARVANPVIEALETVGWAVVKFRFDTEVMGNWHIDLVHGCRSLQIVKDRSQFLVSGPPIEELTAAGLWRAFDDPAKFHLAIINWARNKQRV